MPSTGVQRTAQVAAAAVGLTLTLPQTGHEFRDLSATTLTSATFGPELPSAVEVPTHELYGPPASAALPEMSMLGDSTTESVIGAKGSENPWAKVLVGIAVLAGIATIGKRYFIELPQHLKDLFLLLRGNSLLSGPIYTHHFTEKQGKWFMEVDSFGTINVRELFEQKHAQIVFKGAAKQCTPDQPLVSLNYGAVFRGPFWRMVRLFTGWLPDNDLVRQRFDERFRDEYSSKFRGQIKRKLGGFRDQKELHVVIPFVEVTTEVIADRRKTVVRQQLGFAAVPKVDLERFSDPEWVERLLALQPRYEPRIRLFQAACRIQAAYVARMTSRTDVQLVAEHPDFEVRQPSFFPMVRVFERTPKNGQSTNGNGEGTQV